MKDSIKWIMIGNSIAWLSIMGAVMYATYITKDVGCLWFLLIAPVCSYGYSVNEKSKEENNGED